MGFIRWKGENVSNMNDFNISSNGLLCKYTGSGGDVIIPEEVNSIGWSAFENCSDLTGVVIPGGVKSICSNSFKDCCNLKRVTIEEGVEVIEYNAFQNCTSLEYLELPNSVEKIMSYAFAGCIGLTNAKLPDGLQELEQGLFSGYSSLRSIALPVSVTEIGKNVFDSCSSLVDVIIPGVVKKVGYQAFSGCKALADKEGFVIVNGILYDYLGPGGSVTVPSSVKEIAPEVFRERDLFGEKTYREKDERITEIVIPEGVTAIGDNAFQGCSVLKYLSLPKSLRKIGCGAFSTTIEDSAWPLQELWLPQGCFLEEDCFAWSVKKTMHLNADFFAVPDKLPPYYAEYFSMAVPEAHSTAMCRLYQSGKAW